MATMLMDIINAFGCQLIPGFLALYLLLYCGFILSDCETGKAGRCASTSSRYALNSTLNPVKK